MQIPKWQKRFFQQLMWISIHCLILGSFVIAYTSLITTVENTQLYYALMGGFVGLLVVYVLGAVMMDRISRTIGEITDNIESINNSVENIAEELPESEK